NHIHPPSSIQPSTHLSRPSWHQSIPAAEYPPPGGHRTPGQLLQQGERHPHPAQQLPQQ
ncbi:unnamed protein product, partial [Closterium sp. NIES-53]